MNLKTEKLLNQAMCLIMAIFMLISILPLQSTKAEETDVCTCHVYEYEHTFDCGFSPDFAGSPCYHEHNEFCYINEFDEFICEHNEHDILCGYEQAVQGNACVYVCPFCLGTLFNEPEDEPEYEPEEDFDFGFGTLDFGILGDDDINQSLAVSIIAKEESYPSGLSAAFDFYSSFSNPTIAGKVTVGILIPSTFNGKIINFTDNVRAPIGDPDAPLSQCLMYQYTDTSNNTYNFYYYTDGLGQNWITYKTAVGETRNTSFMFLAPNLTTENNLSFDLTPVILDDGGYAGIESNAVLTGSSTKFTSQFGWVDVNKTASYEKYLDDDGALRDIVFQIDFANSFSEITTGVRATEKITLTDVLDLGACYYPAGTSVDDMITLRFPAWFDTLKASGKASSIVTPINVGGKITSFNITITVDKSGSAFDGKDIYSLNVTCEMNKPNMQVDPSAVTTVMSNTVTAKAWSQAWNAGNPTDPATYHESTKTVYLNKDNPYKISKAIYTDAAATTLHENVFLTDGQDYYYKIIATNNSGTSGVFDIMDALDFGLVYQSFTSTSSLSAPKVEGQYVTWESVTIPNNGTVEIIVKVNVNGTKLEQDKFNLNNYVVLYQGTETLASFTTNNRFASLGGNVSELASYYKTASHGAITPGQHIGYQIIFTPKNYSSYKTFDFVDFWPNEYMFLREIVVDANSGVVQTGYSVEILYKNGKTVVYHADANGKIILQKDNDPADAPGQNIVEIRFHNVVVKSYNCIRLNGTIKSNIPDNVTEITNSIGHGPGTGPSDDPELTYTMYRLRHKKEAYLYDKTTHDDVPGLVLTNNADNPVNEGDIVHYSLELSNDSVINFKDYSGGKREGNLATDIRPLFVDQLPTSVKFAGSETAPFNYKGVSAYNIGVYTQVDNGTLIPLEYVGGITVNATTKDYNDLTPTQFGIDYATGKLYTGRMDLPAQSTLKLHIFIDITEQMMRDSLTAGNSIVNMGYVMIYGNENLQVKNTIITNMGDAKAINVIKKVAATAMNVNITGNTFTLSQIRTNTYKDQVGDSKYVVYAAIATSSAFGNGPTVYGYEDQLPPGMKLVGVVPMYPTDSHYEENKILNQFMTTSTSAEFDIGTGHRNIMTPTNTKVEDWELNYNSSTGKLTITPDRPFELWAENGTPDYTIGCVQFIIIAEVTESYPSYTNSFSAITDRDNVIVGHGSVGYYDADKIRVTDEETIKNNEVSAGIRKVLYGYLPGNQYSFVQIDNYDSNPEVSLDGLDGYVWVLKIYTDMSGYSDYQFHGEFQVVDYLPPNMEFTTNYGPGFRYPTSTNPDNNVGLNSTVAPWVIPAQEAMPDGRTKLTWTIPASNIAYRSEYNYSSIVFSTKLKSVKYGSYVNNAEYYPGFTPTSISHGAWTADKKGATGNAVLNCFGSYGTISYKEIKNTGSSSYAGLTGIGNDASNNSIYASGVGDKVRYTLNVKSIAASGTVDKLVLIDELPRIGDKGVVNREVSRESEFPVNFDATPNVVVTLYDSAGSPTTVNPSNYTVSYRANTGSLSETDWTGGGSGWSSTVSPTSHDTIRIVFNDGYTIPTGSKIAVSYDCVIGTGADIDQVAWSSFGYGYSIGVIRIYAEPERVGVRIPAASIEITKRVTAYEGAAVPDTSFTFKLTNNSGTALSGIKYKIIGDSTTYTTNSNGEFALKANQTATFIVVPGTYKVVETVPNGFELTAIATTTGTGSTSTATFTTNAIAANSKASAEFTNNFKRPVPGTYTPNGVKTISGDKTTVNADEFSFTLTADASNVTENYTYSGTLPHTVKTATGGAFNFGTFTFNQAGTYKFTVNEVNESVSGITYDNKPVTITVVVNSSLTATATYSKNGAATGSINFANIFSSTPTPVKFTPSGNKTLTGGDKTNANITAGQFEFTLAQVSASVASGYTYGSALPQTIGVAAGTATGGAINFGEFTFTKEGTYIFSITEKNLGVPNYTYDSGVVEMTVVVTKGSDNKLSTAVTYKKGGSTAGGITFANTYTEPDPTAVKFSALIEKVLTGSTLIADQFNFNIAAVSGTATTYTYSGGALPQSISHNASGVLNIGTFTFTKAGIYSFNITETNGGAAGYTYDTKVIRMDIEVTKQGDNLVIVSVNFEETAGAAAAERGTLVNSDGGIYRYSTNFKFNNTYTQPTPAKLTPSGNKTLTGGGKTNSDIAANQFKFTMTEKSANSADGYSYNGTLGAEVGTIAGGTFSFGELTFTKIGTYVFEIAEVNSGAAGYTYDANKVTMTVNVTLNTTNNTLVTNVSYAKENTAETQTTIKFNNIYAEPSSAKLTPTGTKNLTGGGKTNSDIAANQFKFKMTEKSATPASGYSYNGTLGDEVGTTAGGTFSFGELTFTKAGTYVFEIAEVNSGAAGYTYDANKVTMTVTVTLNDDNRLVTNVSYAKENTAETQTSIKFNNTYTEPSSVKLTPSGTKNLTGGGKANSDITADQFKFKMTETSAVAGGYSYNGTLGDEVGTIAGGTFSFGELTFTKAGTYVFEIAEVNGNITGYTYDSNKVTLTVNVTLNTTNNNLVATPVYTKENITGNQSGIVFNNTYTKPNPTNFIPAGTKNLTGGDKTNADIKANQFSFKLEYVSGDTNEFAYSANGGLLPHTVFTSAGNGTFSFGEFTFTKDGVYTFRISEIQGSEIGYTYDNNPITMTVTVVKGADNSLSATAVYEKNSGAVTGIVFANSYSHPAPISVTPNGTKSLTGDLETRNITAGQFSFTLAEGADTVTANYTYGSGLSLPQTLTTVAGGAINFQEFNFIREGTYNFILSEINGNVTGFEYDVNPVTLTIVVEKIAGNTLRVASVTYTKNGDTIDKAEFVNVYTNPDPVEFTPNGNKTLIGDKSTSDIQAGQFKFTLTEKSTNNKAFYTYNGSSGALSDTVNVTAGTGAFSFKTIQFTDVGEYIFYVNEVNSDVTGYTYDDSTIEIKVVVTKNRDNQLVTEITYKKDSATANGIAFENSFENPKPIDFTPNGSKRRTGDSPVADISDDLFNFVLTEDASNDSSIYDFEDVAKNSASAKSGETFDFSKITFNNVGTFKFNVVETNGGITGYTYDNRTYTITVVVSLERTNELSKVVTYAINGEAKDAVEFVNDYKNPKPVNFTPNGTKTLTGDRTNADIHAGDFRFTLSVNTIPGQSMSNYYSYKGNNGVLPHTVDVLANGTFTFDIIEFTEIGTYYFYINEIDRSVEIPDNDDVIGYDYDKGQIEVKVVVTKNSENELVTAITYKKDETAAQGVSFANTFTNPTPVDYIPEGSKRLIGDRPIADISSTLFSFVLSAHTTNDTSRYTYDGIMTDSVSVKAGETFQFGKLTFTNVGTFKFDVVETNGGLTGFTYDNTRFTINVAVKLEKDNTLSKIVTYFINNEPVTAIEFVNRYNNPTEMTFTLDGRKTLTGDKTNADITAGQFNFNLANGANNDAARYVYSSNNGVLPHTVPVLANGTFNFGTIRFLEEGTFVFMVNEVTGNVPGYTYDNSYYIIAVIVTKNANNVLEKRVTITKNGETSAVELTFNNSYKVEPTEVLLTGTKKLGGAMLYNNQFAFAVYENSTVVATGTNNASGLITFSKIEYTKPGVHTYTIRETSQGGSGYYIDTKIYTVVVTVVDVNSKLVATVAYGNDPIVFNNFYYKENGKVTLRLKKQLTDQNGYLADVGKPFVVRLYDKNMNQIGVYTLLSNSSEVVVSGLQAGTTYYLQEDTQSQTRTIGFEVSGVGSVTGNTATISVPESTGTYDISVIVKNQTIPNIEVPTNPPINPHVDIPVNPPVITIPAEPTPKPQITPMPPKTGDDNILGIAIAIMITSLFSVIVVMATGKKRSKAAKN